MRNGIRVALAGIGNVASALIQGVSLARKQVGTVSSVLGDRPEGMVVPEFVVGFDVNEKKVGSRICEAIAASPNCAREICQPALGIAEGVVLKGPILDGVPPIMQECVSVDSSQKEVDVEDALRKHEVEVVVILLPTGSDKAAEKYARAAISAGCAVVNGIPSSIANNRELVDEAKRRDVPVIGDDIKSQIGATAVHRALVDVFGIRGGRLSRTMQLDWGGDMDFFNLVREGRYDKGKRLSKTVGVMQDLDAVGDTDIHISAVDFIEFLGNRKEAYGRLEGHIFGQVPVRVSFFLEVEDAFNAAGVLVDMIEVAAKARRARIGGVLEDACVLFCKRPPLLGDDMTARSRVADFLGIEKMVPKKD